MNPLTLLRRVPADKRDDAPEPDLDVPTYMRRIPHARPLTWTATPPQTTGFRHARMPGAERHTVVLVTRDSEGVLVYGVSQVAYKPVVGSDLEWGSCAIQDPH